MKYFYNNMCKMVLIFLSKIPVVRDYNNISVSDSLADITYHLFVIYKIQRSFNFTPRLAFVKWTADMSSTMSLMYDDNNSYLESTGDLHLVDLHPTCL